MKQASPVAVRPAVLVLAVSLALSSPACGMQGEAEPPESVAEQRAEPTRSIPDSDTRVRLSGWWLRHDQSYMMVLDEISETGEVDARYLNPKPVHVSKAGIWIEDGFIRLLLELTDKNYPGNYYELAYAADRDIWIGLYHHLGNDETYEVYFTRFEDEEDAP